MPVYNGSKFVAEAVRSILAQTFEDFEFIIVDDGSTDNTLDILGSFSNDARLVVKKQVRNMGVREALNAGCQLARAPIIARMDADDISLPDRFAKQMAFLARHADIGVLGTSLRIIDAEGRPTGRTATYLGDPALVAWQLLFVNCLAHPTVMMRRDLLEDVGYYPEGCLAEDYALFLALSRRTRLASLPDVLLEYRVWGQSVTQQKFEALERDARRVLRDSVNRWWSIELTDSSADLLRGLSMERYPKTGEEASEVADALTALLRAYTSTTKLKPAELDTVRTDAAVKMWLLAAVSLTRTPFTAARLAARAQRTRPTSVLYFARKAISRIAMRPREFLSRTIHIP
jgi:hypothetical protein